MKITIARDMTEKYLLNRTKEQAKEFSEAYTEEDLLRIFSKSTGIDVYNPHHEILKSSIQAFPGGYMETDENHYAVDMIIMTYEGFAKLYFYISQSCVIDTRTPSETMGLYMYGIRYFTEN